jgi:hypothetical protein
MFLRIGIIFFALFHRFWAWETICKKSQSKIRIFENFSFRPLGPLRFWVKSWKAFSGFKNAQKIDSSYRKTINRGIFQHFSCRGQTFSGFEHMCICSGYCYWDPETIIYIFVNYLQSHSITSAKTIYCHYIL